MNHLIFRNFIQRISNNVNWINACFIQTNNATCESKFDFVEKPTFILHFFKKIDRPWNAREPREHRCTPSSHREPLATRPGSWSEGGVDGRWRVAFCENIIILKTCYWFKKKIKFIQIKGPVEEKLEIRFLRFFGRKSIPFDDFVIDVSDVHDELDVVVEVVHHDATQNVHAQIRARVAHVRRVIDRRTAHVPFHLETQ